MLSSRWLSCRVWLAQTTPGALQLNAAPPAAAAVRFVAAPTITVRGQVTAAVAAVEEDVSLSRVAVHVAEQEQLADRGDVLDQPLEVEDRRHDVPVQENEKMLVQ